MRNILDYIEQVKDMYEGTGSMAQGPRNTYSQGQLVTPSVDGSRPGYNGRDSEMPYYKKKHKLYKKPKGKYKHKIENQFGTWYTNKPPGVSRTGTPLSEKQAEKVRKLLKNHTQERGYKGGLTLTKASGVEDGYIIRSIVEKDKKRIQNDLVYTPENFKKMIERHETIRSQVYPNQLNNIDFKKLRLENSQLTDKAFAELLNEKGYTTLQGNKWNLTMAHRIKQRLDLGTLGPNTFRSIDEAKEIIRNAKGGKFFLKGKPTDSQILSEASKIIHSKNWGGSFPRTPDKESTLWYNFNRAANGGSKQITYDLSALDDELPRDADGNINWKKEIKLKNGTTVPAWKAVKFKDNTVGKTFSWNDTKGSLRKQVDNAHYQGFFQKSMKAYDDQTIVRNIDIDGTRFGTMFQEKVLKDELTSILKREPTKKELTQWYTDKRPGFSLSHVHHPEGVSTNVYNVQNVYKDANLAQEALTRTYRADIKKAGGNPNKIKTATDKYKKSLEKLSSEWGGITTKVGSRYVGDVPTSESVFKTAAKELTKNVDLSTEEGRRLNRQIGTTKVLNKILEKNNIKICNDKLSKGKGVVCGAKFAERDPNGFMEAIKRNKDAVKIINKPGLVKGALRGVSGWAKKELGPFGWIGSIATIDSAFGAYALGQGKTPLQALDETLWFLPESVLKADEKNFKNVYKKAGFTDEDFGEFQKWKELEDLDKQYFMSQRQLKFMEDQVLKPENKSAADIAYQKEVDAIPDMYKNMGWMYPKFTISSEQEKTGKHPFYGPAVDRYNKILDRSGKVYGSLKDPDKSWKDLDYTRKLVAMKQANRKKKLMRESLKYAPHLIPVFEPFAKTGPKEMKDQSFLYDEYVHPLYGPSVSPEQIAAVDEGRFRAQIYSDGGRAGYMGGGIAAIRKPNALPPTGGPQSGGLPSLYNNGRKL